MADYQRCGGCRQTVYPDLEAALKAMLRLSRYGGQFETVESCGGFHVHKVGQRRTVDA